MLELIELKHFIRFCLHRSDVDKFQFHDGIGSNLVLAISEKDSRVKYTLDTDLQLADNSIADIVQLIEDVTKKNVVVTLGKNGFTCTMGEENC